MPRFFKLLYLKTKEINVKDVFPEGHGGRYMNRWTCFEVPTNALCGLCFPL